MNTELEVSTQAELEAVIAAGDVPVVVAGDLELVTNGTVSPRVVLKLGALRVVAYGSSQPRVEAWGSSQPRVEAWGSSQPRVEAWGLSQPRVVAWGSSQPRVVAWGSSQPRVEAHDSSQPRVEAWGSSQPRVEAKGTVQLSVSGAVAVVAAATVTILVSAGNPKIDGGGFVQHVDCNTPQAWCDHYGVKVINGVAILYKGVRSKDMCSPRNFSYAIGTVPVAPDWDGGEQECGKGLHYSPTPSHTLEFYRPDADGPVEFLACPVALSDMAVHPDGAYPQKCKARGQVASAWQVDEDGEPVAGAVVTWPPAVEPKKVTKAKSKRARKPKRK